MKRRRRDSCATLAGLWLVLWGLGVPVSDDEILVLILGLVAILFPIFSWYGRLIAPQLAPYPGNWRTVVGLAPVAAFSVVLAALMTLAASDVRTAPVYIAFYLVIGAAWVFYATLAMSWFGISVRDDAVERRNPAAAILIICAMLSHAIIFSGANVGDGPGWWVVLITGTLAAGSWFILWFLIEMFCDAHEVITVNRDVAAAIRLGGLMLAMAVVLARAAAGDWVSLPETLVDFQVAWPAPLLAIVGILIERSAGRSGVWLSVVLAIAYVSLGVAAVAASPPLSHNPVYDLPAGVTP
jgi:hypothetical protein